jgi:hypothetical protein
MLFLMMEWKDSFMEGWKKLTEEYEVQRPSVEIMAGIGGFALFTFRFLRKGPVIGLQSFSLWRFQRSIFQRVKTLKNSLYGDKLTNWIIWGTHLTKFNLTNAFFPIKAVPITPENNLLTKIPAYYYRKKVYFSKFTIIIA